MKILYINSVCNWGSTGKITYSLCRQSREAGHDAVVCYGRGPRCQAPFTYQFGLNWETYLHALLTRITGWTGCFSPLSTRRLLRFMEDFHPDIVHIHELHAYFVDLRPVLRYLAEHNIPLVQTLHCEFTYTGKCGYAYECDRWQDRCGNCPHLQDYPKTRWFDHTAAMLAEKKKLFGAIPSLVVAAPSRWLADRARKSFLKDREICIVHNGIDTKQVFHPRSCTHLRQRYGIRPEEKIVLAVAPDLMSQRKGGRWVLKLAQEMAQEQIRFVLVGVKDLTEQFPQNVTAVGLLSDQQELAAHYSMAGCFVICSEKENFPTTCLEAFCCGTPVAGFATGGTAETVPAPHGLFCEYGNVPALAEKVRCQLEQKFSREEVAREGQSLYSRETMYQAYQELYQQLGVIGT